MPILELFPKPSRAPDQTPETTGDADTNQANGTASQSLRLHTSRYGELEEHEIIHLLDSLDDERSRARFRESIYISSSSTSLLPGSSFTARASSGISRATSTPSL